MSDNRPLTVRELRPNEVPEAMRLTDSIFAPGILDRVIPFARWGYHDIEFH